MSARYIVGDVRDVLATLEDDSVDLILTSPPFLALRSYLPADHPDKHREIGSEPTPAAFLDTLLDLTEEWARVLTPHGSLCVELGDTYAGGGQGPDPGKYAAKENVVTVARSHGPGWPQDKSLCLIPQSYAWALTYGRNPFNGRETPPWRVRNIVRWCRPNPPVGALGDKFRPATSELIVACKARDRWFDLDAVREEHQYPQFLNKPVRVRGRTDKSMMQKPSDVITSRGNPAGAPPLDYWEIPTQPYAGSHYATWPEKLCVRPILSMCPREVCRTCGQPRRRSGEVEYLDDRGQPLGERCRDSDSYGRGGHASPNQLHATRVASEKWTDCGHNNYRRGQVLDPFAGSGTTLAIAEGHARNSIGIDLDPRNADLAYDRIGGLFLQIETLEAAS